MELSYSNLISLLEKSHRLFHIGLLLLCGYVGGKVANYVKVPRVSGYLVAGMLLSPSILGVFREELVKEDLTIIYDDLVKSQNFMEFKACPLSKNTSLAVSLRCGFIEGELYERAGKRESNRRETSRKNRGSDCRPQRPRAPACEPRIKH